MGKSKLAVLAAMASSLCLAVAGCSSSDSAAGSSSGTTTVSIGVGVPLTDGAVAMGQGIVRGVNLAVAEANKSSELTDLGLKIAVVEGDDKGDPTTGGNVATQFASNPNLIGVVGHLNSGVARVAVKTYNQANLVEVSPANTAADLTQMGMSNFFRVCATDPVQGPAGAAYAVSTIGAKTAFVLDDSTTYGEGLANAWVVGFQEKGGSLVGREKTTDKDTNFTALAAAIKNSGADMVYYGGMYNSGALLTRQLSEAGYTKPLMGGDGLYDPEFIRIAGAGAAAGDFATSVGAPVSELPKAQEFTAAYKAMFPNDSIGAYDAQAYDSANTIINAVKVVAKDLGAGKLTSTEGKKAIIAAVAKSNFDGVTGPISFDAKGDTLNGVITVYKVNAAGEWEVAS